MNQDAHDHNTDMNPAIPGPYPLPQVYAGFWRRLGALLVDIAVIMPVLILQYHLYTVSKTAAYLSILLLPPLHQVYTVYFHYRWGATIGKMAVGIRVTTLDGYPITIVHALTRSSVDIVYVVLWIGASLAAMDTLGPEVFTSGAWQEVSREIAENQPFDFKYFIRMHDVWFWSEVIVILFNKKRRALHDFIAGTVVVHKRPSQRTIKDEDAITIELTRDMERLQKSWKR